jgi:hypothetical protein
MLFQYKANGEEGPSAGSIEAPDRDTAFAVLTHRRLSVVELRESSVAPPVQVTKKLTGWRAGMQRGLLLLVAVGSLVLIFTFERPAYAPETPSGEREYTFEINGFLPEPEVREVVLDFAEIPLLYRPAGEQLELMGGGQFRARFQLTLSRKPTGLKVRNGSSESQEVPLVGDLKLVGNVPDSYHKDASSP